MPDILPEYQPKVYRKMTRDLLFNGVFFDQVEDNLYVLKLTAMPQEVHVRPSLVLLTKEMHDYLILHCGIDCFEEQRECKPRLHRLKEVIDKYGRF